jgi:hypothetical protein
MTPDQITLINVSALLSEAMHNGKLGPKHLYAWLLGEQNLIEQTAKELDEMLLENIPGFQ